MTSTSRCRCQQGVSDLAVGVTAGPEPEIVWLCAIALSMLCCVSALRLRRRPSTVAQSAASEVEGRRSGVVS